MSNVISAQCGIASSYDSRMKNHAERLAVHKCHQRYKNLACTAWWMAKNYFCHYLVISVPFLCIIFQSFSCHSALRLSFLQSFLCHSVIALHSSVLCCFQFIGRVLVCVARLWEGEQLKDKGPGIGAGPVRRGGGGRRGRPGVGLAGGRGWASAAGEASPEPAV